MILREALHAHLPTLSVNDTVRDAVDKMDVYQFPGLVVVDDDRRPIAIVTEGDLVRAAQTRGNVASLAMEPAVVYGSKEPTVAEADLDVGDAFHKMSMSGLTLLPVVEEGRLLGIVLRVDLMQAILMDSVGAQP